MKLRQLCAVLVVASVAIAGGSSAWAASETPKDIVAEKLQKVASTWKDKKPESIVDDLYVDETEITGDGVPELYTGRKGLVELVQHLMEISKSTTIEMNKFSQLADNVAYTWVTWTVTPADASAPFNMKSLFVWKKTPHGWRIVADMFANGAMPK